MKQARIIVSGHVQDVGFRASVEENARECDLVGYVKNLTDGTVEIVCEGRAKDIKRLLSRIEAINAHATVKNVRTKFGKAAGKFGQFAIEYEDMAVETFKILKLGTKHAMQTSGSLGRIETRLESMDNKLDSMDNKLDSMDNKLDSIDGKLDSMDSKLDSMDNKLDSMDKTLHGVDNKLDSMDKTLYKIADSQVRMEETMEEVRLTLKDTSQEDMLAE